MKAIVITGALCAAIGAVGKSWLHSSVQPKNRHDFLKWDGRKYTKVSK